MKSRRFLSFLIVANLSIASLLATFDSVQAFQGNQSGPRGEQPTGQNGMGPNFLDYAAPMVQAASSRPPKGVTTGNAQNIRPNPKPSKCLMLAKRIGASRVWWGRHVGAKEIEDDDLFFSVGPRRVEFDDIGCFQSKKDCQNWLYWKRTEYPLFGSISPCRRGL